MTFTDFHIEQIRLARTAFQIEILQNGLRKKIFQMVKLSAAGKFDQALTLTETYVSGLRQERDNAEDAIHIVKQIISGETQENRAFMKRKENGYRIYTGDDIKRLKIIRSLRCANYSLEAILRMLRQLTQNPNVDIKAVLNTPRPSDDIISACDQLIFSLSAAEKNAVILMEMLQKMKRQYS